MKKRSKKGFTLVELVVVIAILAILAAIAVPQLLGFQTRAREQADKQTAVQIRNAIALLNANGELGTAATATYTVLAADDSVTASGFHNGADTPVALAAAAVQALVEDLTDAVEVVGTKNLVVTLTTDGTVTVTSP